MNQLTVDVNGGAAMGAAQQMGQVFQQPYQGGQVGGFAGDVNQSGMFYYQPNYWWPNYPNYYGPHRCPNCGRCPCCGR